MSLTETHEHMARVEQKARERYELSNQGAWEDLPESYKRMHRSAVESEVSEEENQGMHSVSIKESEHEDHPKYVVYNPITDNYYYVFGMIQGGETKGEAVFWAERLASKNGLTFKRPDGWEDVISKLPEKDDTTNG